MASRSRSSQTTSSSNEETITNQVDGNGDGNINTDFANSDGNSVTINEVDNGAVEAAFDFGAMALDSVVASQNAANDLSSSAIQAAENSTRDQGAVNSEKIVKTLVTGAAVIALGLLGIRMVGK